MTEKEIQQEYERICKKIGCEPKKFKVVIPDDITESDESCIVTICNFITHDEAWFLYEHGFLD